jgi:hypothetical protein
MGTARPPALHGPSVKGCGRVPERGHPCRAPAVQVGLRVSSWATQPGPPAGRFLCVKVAPIPSLLLTVPAREGRLAGVRCTGYVLGHPGPVELMRGTVILGQADS